MAAWLSRAGAPGQIWPATASGILGNGLCRALDFADAVQLVRQRGAFMQTPCRWVRAMAAIIGLDDDVINQVCSARLRSAPGVVAAVNFNSPAGW